MIRLLLISALVATSASPSPGLTKTKYERTMRPIVRALDEARRELGDLQQSYRTPTQLVDRSDAQFAAVQRRLAAVVPPIVIAAHHRSLTRAVALLRLELKPVRAAAAKFEQQGYNYFEQFTAITDAFMLHSPAGKAIVREVKAINARGYHVGMLIFTGPGSG